MIEFNFHIKHPTQQTCNVVSTFSTCLTKNKLLEIHIINKSYTWFKVEFSISRLPYIMLGLFKHVLVIKIKYYDKL